MAKDDLTGNMPTEKLLSCIYKENTNLNPLSFESVIKLLNCLESFIRAVELHL
jgi:hypothetical protein